MTGKKHLWILLTLMLLASIAMVNVPVQSAPPPPEPEGVRLYIRESPPPADYINGTTVPSPFSITVDIESPSAWDDTSAGIVGYSFNVHVNPSVLLVMFPESEESGYFLRDFIDVNGYTGHEPKLLVEVANPGTGDLKFGELIFGFETLGVGVGGSSYNGSTYGSTGGLCTIKFMPISTTAFTRIEISNATWIDINGDKHSFDVIDSGRYNPPVYHNLTVESTPTDGIDFTTDWTTYTTNVTVALEEGNYIVTIPNPATVAADPYMFVEWEDTSTDLARAVSLFTDKTITATYENREAALVGHGAWPEHHHFDISKHGDIAVHDPKGTSGYQTLFAKVKNIGETSVTAKVVFELVKITKIVIETDSVTMEPGDPFVLLEGNFSGLDEYPWDPSDMGKWKVTATLLYYNPYTDAWAPGAKMKTFGFAVVA